MRVGYLKADFEKEKDERKEHDEAALAKLRSLGAELSPVTLPDYPLGAISLVLSTEAATAFDDRGRDQAGRVWLRLGAS